MAATKADQTQLMEKPWRKGIPDKWEESEVKGLTEIFLRKHHSIGQLLTNEERSKGLTVFLVGPSGHGKSSAVNGLLNSIENEDKYTTKAVVRDQTDQATLEYRRHRSRLPVSDKTNPQFVDVLGQNKFILAFADFVGVTEEGDEAKEGNDFKPRVRAALFGVLPEKHKAEKQDELSEKVLSEKDDKPQVEESTTEAACVVWVVDIQSEEKHLGYMKEIVKDATRLGLPQALFLTKCDDLDAKVEEDPKNMYFSPTVYNKLKDVASIVGVPINRTFPIKNYTDEMEVMPVLSFQYLYALQFIMADIEQRQRSLLEDPERLEQIQKEQEELASNDPDSKPKKR